MDRYNEFKMERLSNESRNCSIHCTRYRLYALRMHLFSFRVFLTGELFWLLKTNLDEFLGNTQKSEHVLLYSPLQAKIVR